MQTYSYNQSLLKAFACPYQGKHLRDRAQKTPSREVVTNTGSALHAFAKAYFTHCWATEQQTDLDAAPQIARKVLLTSGIQDNEAEDFLRLADGFVQTELAPEKGATALEEVIATPDKRFFGTPDMVEFPFEAPNRARISDWKTWRRIRTETELKGDIQLRFYAGIMSELHPEIEGFGLRVVFCRHGREVQWEYPAEEARAFMPEMRSKAGALDALAEFPPRAGTQCDWCELAAASCPLVLSKHIAVIADADAALRAAVQLYASEKAVKTLKESLKPWVDLNGPVELDGVTLDFIARTSTVYDTEKTYKALHAEGVSARDIFRGLSITASAIKRICKKAGLSKEDAADVLSLGEPKTGTAFGFKRTAEDDEADEEGEEAAG